MLYARTNGTGVTEIKMRKKCALLIVLLLLLTKIFGNERDDQIIYAMLMNQIQFSLQTIQYYQNRIILDQEYNNIICKIDKTKLKDKDNKAIYAYGNMLALLTDLKLQENEKIFVTQEAEKEKSQAIYKSLVGFTLPVLVSIYQLGKGISEKDRGQIISGSASALYTGISALFNYKNTINNIEKNLRKELFKLDQDQLKSINGQRESLFKTYSEFITKYGIPKQYEIKEDQMRWLVETLDKADASSKINLLEAKRNIFSVFTPFWFELGCAYQELGKIEKAKDCYSEFVKLKTNYSIIDNDSYYTELAKNMIQIAIEEKNESMIRKYLSIIENDSTANNESENRFYSAGIYYYLKDFNKAQQLLKLIIDDNRKFVPQSREFFQLVSTMKTNDAKNTSILLLSQLKIISEEEVKKVVIKKRGNLSIFSDTLNFFVGKEEEKVFYYDKLVFSLPKEVGENYSLGFLIKDKYYDSLNYEMDDRIYYFVDYVLTDFMEDFNTFSLYLIDKKGLQIKMEFNSEYYNKGSIKKLNKAFQTLSQNKNDYLIDISNISQINVDSFLQGIKLLENDKIYKKKTESEKANIISKYYETSVKDFLKAPYVYKKNTLFKSNNYAYCYGLNKIIIDNTIYSFSKYGELEKPVINSYSLNSSLKTSYKKALLGDSSEAYKIGLAYLNGEGLEINYIEAINWFKVAVQGNEKMKAFYQLAICFENGYGTEKNSDRAKFYYQKAAELGHQKAKEKMK